MKNADADADVVLEQQRDPTQEVKPKNDSHKIHEGSHIRDTRARQEAAKISPEDPLENSLDSQDISGGKIDCVTGSEEEGEPYPLNDPFLTNKEGFYTNHARDTLVPQTSDPKTQSQESEITTIDYGTACEILCAKFELLQRSMRRFYMTDLFRNLKEFYLEELKIDNNVFNWLGDVALNLVESHKGKSLEMLYDLQRYQFYSDFCGWIEEFIVKRKAKLILLGLKKENTKLAELQKANRIKNLVIIFKGIMNQKKSDFLSIGFDQISQQASHNLSNERVGYQWKHFVDRLEKQNLRDICEGLGNLKRFDRMFSVFGKLVKYSYLSQLKTHSNFGKSYFKCNESVIKTSTDRERLVSDGEVLEENLRQINSMRDSNHLKTQSKFGTAEILETAKGLDGESKNKIPKGFRENSRRGSSGKDLIYFIDNPTTASDADKV